jgi:hypothetical protein
MVNPTNIQRESAKSNNQINTSGGHESMVKIRKGYYSFEGTNLNSHADYVYAFEKYGYKDLVGRYKEGKNLSLIGSGTSIVCIVVGVASKQYILVGGGAIIGIIGSVIGNNTRENAIKQFNSRATKNIGLNSNLEIKPFFATNQMGSHLGVSIGF